MTDENFGDLLGRYILGETNLLESEQVEKWFSELDLADTEWKNLAADDRKFFISDLRDAVHKSINAADAVPSVPVKLRLWKVVAKVAAVLIVLTLIVINWASIIGIFYPQDNLKLRTTQHQIEKITLPDGSLAWINSSSELEYQPSFNGKSREVSLTGEAYFDVKHDKNKPFVVHTGEITTTVLGTAFNIKAGMASDKVIVTVTRGKVSVSKKDKILGYITPNQQLIYEVTSASNKKLVADARRITSWQNDIYFDDVTFEEATKQLEKRFHIRIIFLNENLKACRFSGSAMGNKNLDEILTRICAINQAGYQRKSNNEILIVGDGCK